MAQPLVSYNCTTQHKVIYRDGNQVTGFGSIAFRGRFFVTSIPLRNLTKRPDALSNICITTVTPLYNTLVSMPFLFPYVPGGTSIQASFPKALRWPRSRSTYAFPSENRNLLSLLSWRKVFGEHSPVPM